MICVNECLLKIVIRAILEPLAIVISPYAPHILRIMVCLVMKVRGSSSFPSFDPKHLVEVKRISSFFQRENAFYHGVTFGFNRSANRHETKEQSNNLR
jgi:hypothetical protein